MNSEGEMISLLDLLDLDEDVVDTRLKSIMVRSNFTNEHLANALQLLRYKQLINIQEKTQCINTDEFDFVAKLIKLLNADIVENVCKVTTTVLELNTTTLVSYSEHLLLQILNNLDLSEDTNNSELDQSKTLLYLKVCDSVLDATIKHGERLSMLFLGTPLEEILSSRNELLKVHFITSTVPKLAEGVKRYDILSRIWNHLEQSKGENRGTALKVLSSLSDYYLPASKDEKSAIYESIVVFTHSFWELVLHGLMSQDQLQRKISTYLAKRAIDYVCSLKSNINVKSKDQLLFSWEVEKQELYKNQWDNFFILLDSLEEKQSNIVLPSLQLFDTLTVINHKWLNCAYNLGLKHDNGQVRLKCVKYRINTNINSNTEAVVMLGALNDINFYDDKKECKILKDKLKEMLNNENNLLHVLRAIPQAHLSPVPFYHLSDIIGKLHTYFCDDKINKHNKNISQNIIEILKASCNIITIREAIHYNIADFIGKSCKHFHWREIASICASIEFKTLSYKNSLFALIKEWKLNEEDRKEFYKHVTETHQNIDLAMLHLNNHPEDIDIFMDIIYKKGYSIQGVLNRQYSNKMECFNDALYILNLLNKCDNKIKALLPNAHKATLQYCCALLSSDVHLNIDESKSVFNNIQYAQESSLKDLVIQLYKTAVMCLHYPHTDLDAIVKSIFIIDSLTCNHNFVHDFSHEMLGLKQLLQLETTFEKKAISNAQSLGRLRNLFYETHCKLVSTYLSSIVKKNYTDELENEDFEMNTGNGLKNKQNEDVIYVIDSNDSMEVEAMSDGDTTSTNDSDRTKLLSPLINLNNLNERVEDWKQIIDYVEKVIDCGGYGCLVWVLKIVNETFEQTYSYLNITQFISRIWREIEELKSSNHYLPCMKEFVNVITQKALIIKPEFNNIIILYCSRIIEYGVINNSPLYYLVHNDQLSQFIKEQSNSKKLNEYGHIVYILSEILLFCPVPRKDQRIADNLSLEILKNIGADCTISKHHFNFEIQFQAINILSKIHDPEVLKAIITFIRTKIDNTFKAKFRYHGNSQIHRTLQLALQHLLYIRFLKSTMEDDTELDWYLNLLARMPHQPSVKTCLEWHIALHFYTKKMSLDKNLLNKLQSKDVPLPSQMIIIFWLMQHKLEYKYDEDEFHFAMDMLLSHTMGSIFNIRLLAQYLASQLHWCDSNPLNATESKYHYIIGVIDKTLQENKNDKNLLKLDHDYFLDDFDILQCLTPFFLYISLSRFCNVGVNEAVDTDMVSKLLDEIDRHIEVSVAPDFKEEWGGGAWGNSFDSFELTYQQYQKLITTNHQEDSDVQGTIQKKYIPWKSMSDINIYNVDKKRESPSDLIVVASLIDKLPNLGGMARTCEVFGVKTYVIDSLRHLQDRQFQGLSVSAERWIDVEEVRPGLPLKEYLNRKKAEGYSVVAAEQTSTSSKLPTFKFPRKTLLLLGHEKEGIPCDLLPMMDHCVEIPQQGFVRSLNVHVTAAIFVWEYARQNIL